jgi:hypothetical protein
MQSPHIGLSPAQPTTTLVLQCLPSNHAATIPYPEIPCSIDGFGQNLMVNLAADADTVRVRAWDDASELADFTMPSAALASGALLLPDYAPVDENSLDAVMVEQAIALLNRCTELTYTDGFTDIAGDFDLDFTVPDLDTENQDG